MPAEGLDWLPNDKILTNDEIVRLVEIAVTHLGIEEVRFTGGEPLVRRGVTDIVARCAQLSPRPDLSVTTNALGLAKLAGPLAEAGLDRVNVSLDTVRSDTFKELTLRDRFHDVVAGSRGCRRGRAATGEGQRGADARRQRRPGARAAAVVPRPRLRAALHRADAAGRPARLDPRQDDHRRGDLRRASPRASTCRRPRSRGGVRLPSCSPSTAVRRPWASSPPSRDRSAATATGCG